MDTPKTKRSRLRARGAKKVKTGCQTCRLRRKKCDEMKPACSQCLGKQWECDFLALSHSSFRFLPKTPIDLDSDGIMHFEYFRTVCISEFTLYFEESVLENKIMQGAIQETCILHAVLAIGALSRSLYKVDTSPHITFIYSTKQYILAIQALKNSLEGSQNVELALIASIVFVSLEMLHGFGNRIMTLLQSASALARSFPQTDLGYLRKALSRLEDQAEAFFELQNRGDSSLAAA